MVLDVDLNTPVVESFGEEGTSSYPPSSQEAQGGQQGAPLRPAAPIDVDLIDDDVFVSSARAFSEAKQNSRRNRGRTIIDVDLEESTTTRHAANHRNKRLRVPSNQRIINCESYVNLEGCANSMGDKFRPIEQETMPPQPPPPPYKEPSFNCPVPFGSTFLQRVNLRERC
ncbi:hypothetical protein Nepgr_029761 [Nepenthes gracilis]|uniref:Uncharacterized protein n=1 Tax=Nepenthes gracilis TaxID=150966 RepID=A0AAD3TD39_NEPGR|nr:hypothetical protein Nepgr_029761 [Nepenthes gracilis]